MKTIQIPSDLVDLFNTFNSDSDAYVSGFTDGMKHHSQFSKLRLAQLLAERAKPEAPASGAELEQ